MIIPSLFFLTAVFFFWKTLTIPKMERRPKKEESHEIQKGAAVSMLLLVLTVIMRSWTHAGLTTYIPFYYIDYLKGDPIYAGKLVSVFLLGGVAGTLLGSPIADRWGHKPYLVFSLGSTSLLLPLIFAVKGYLLFLVLGTIGMVLISSFTVTIVMAQKILPGNLGIASGLMVGFAIGTGGVGVTILGVFADHYGVPTALKSITILPVVGLAISSLFKYPATKQVPIEK
jgi:FSR family fosmidomycin resistance protein-like MFS transporter